MYIIIYGLQNINAIYPCIHNIAHYTLKYNINIIILYKHDPHTYAPSSGDMLRVHNNNNNIASKFKVYVKVTLVEQTPPPP